MAFAIVLFPRARIRIGTHPDGSRDVAVTGGLARYAGRIGDFVSRERVPDGTVYLTRAGRVRFRGPFGEGIQQQIRNFLAAECRTAP